MPTHCATLSPVTPPGSVACHGPSEVVVGSRLSYKSRLAFVPSLPVSRVSVVGEVGASVNPTEFDVPKTQVATPRA